jgi:predicted secreted hydrolase
MYPRFKSEWWAYRAAYHTHIQDDLPQGEGLGVEVKNMVEDIEELAKIWETTDIYFDRSKKYIMEALDTIVKYRKYRVFEYTAISQSVAVG